MSVVIYERVFERHKQSQRTMGITDVARMRGLLTSSQLRHLPGLSGGVRWGHSLCMWPPPRKNALSKGTCRNTCSQPCYAAFKAGHDHEMHACKSPNAVWL